MIELYHAANSTCSQKVRLALAEKGLAWTSHHLELRRFDQLRPEFLALNPDAVVPVLVDDGQVIRESMVINEYLEDAYPEVPLRPASPAARAAMRTWTLYIASEPTWAVKVPSFEANIRPQLAGTLEDTALENVVARIPNRETALRWRKVVREGFNREEIDASLARLARTLDRMAGALAQMPWLAGTEYSLADVDMVPFVHRLAQIGQTAMIAAQPRVADWYARLRSRPAFATAFDWRP